MPAPPETPSIGREVFWTAEEFPDRTEPGRVLHRFFKTQGEYLPESSVGEPIIHSAEPPVFAIRRDRLNPPTAPDVDARLAEIPNLSAPLA